MPNIQEFVDFDATKIRPSEVDLLIGDATKVKLKFGEEPKTSFEKRIEIMIENDLKTERKMSKSSTKDD